MASKGKGGGRFDKFTKFLPGKKDKHKCPTCGEKTKKKKCMKCGQHVEQVSEGDHPQQASTSEEECETSGVNGANRFNASQTSVDGLSSIRASRHDDLVQSDKFEKTVSGITSAKASKEGSKFDKEVKVPRVTKADRLSSPDEPTSSPDAPPSRVSFAEILQCRKCGHEHREKMEKCECCGSKLKEDTLNHSLEGKLTKREWSRRLTQKRKLSISKRTKLKIGGKSVKVKDQREAHIKEAKKLLEGVENLSKKKGTRYEDKSFPKQTPDHCTDKNWIVLKDIKCEDDDGSPWVLYGEETSAADVSQGANLDDCWFSAAMACLGERKDLLEKIIISTDINPHGVYVLRLCKDGAWKKVLVDDRFPCDDKKQLLYHVVHGKRKVLWPLLLQKAAAKLVGGYDHLNAGLIVEAMSMLTGEPCELLRLRKGISQNDEEILPEANAVWEKLQSSKEKGHMIGVATPPEILCSDSFKESGLSSEHAFAVLEVKEEGNLRVLKLINPWAKSDLRECLQNSVLKDNGFSCNTQSEKEFWITLEELMAYFMSLSFCEAQEDDTLFEIRMKGTFPPSFAELWKYYLFTVTHPDTELHFGLFQKNLRDRGATQKENFNDIMLLVMQNPSAQEKPFLSGPLFTKVVAYSERKARSLVTCKTKLDPGRYTVACFGFRQLHTSKGSLSDEDWVDLNKDFMLVIHSSSVIYGDEVDKGSHELLTHAPADAIILLTKQLCIEARDSEDKKQIEKRRADKLTEGVNAYILDWWGQMYVLENNTQQCVVITRDYTESEFLINSRGDMCTTDIVPPKKCQLINVMTAQMPDLDWTVAASKKMQLKIADSEITHNPTVKENFEGLHGARPIPETV